MTRDWTDDDVARLKAMAQKFPTAKIARDLGRSIGATIVKAHQLKLSLRIKPGNPGPAGMDLSWPARD